jgi:hypothetical protein
MSKDKTLNHLSTINTRRFIAAYTSRRGLLAAASGGLLAAGPLAPAGESEAKKKRHRPRRGQKNRKTNDNTTVQVDAICPGPTDNSGFALNEGALFAQTFTALSSGRLALAELLIEPVASGSAALTLQLREVDAAGGPSDTVLAEASLDISGVPAGLSTVFFSFADRAAVSANRDYALVLSKTGSRTVSWKAHRGDTCGGRFFRSEPNTEPFEVPIDEIDAIFTTIVSS